MSIRQKGKAVGFGIYRDGKSFRLQVTGRDGKRRVLRLRSFGIDKKERAAEIAVRMERLLAIRDLATVPDEGTLAAIRALHPRFREFLGSAGLIPREADERTVHQCLDAFLEAQRGQCKEETMRVLGRAAKHAKAFFPADKELQAVTICDALAFSNWLKTRRGKQSPQLAEATVRKTCSIISQAFRFALRSGWIRSNAFVDSGVKKSVPPNLNRVAYVSIAETECLLQACSNREDRLMVGFARFAALRLPSEISDLRWGDFKNDFKVVCIRASKTGNARSVPVMPSLRQLLLEDSVPSDPSEFVFPRLRRHPSLSMTMRRIIRRSGIKNYPRALHALRASCITDWSKAYPSIAEVASWAGHTIPVMTRYYLRVQADDSALRAAAAAHAEASSESEGGAGAVRAA
jgi:integrase